MANTIAQQIETVIKDSSQEFVAGTFNNFDKKKNDKEIKQQIKDYFENTNYKPLHIINDDDTTETAETVNMKIFLDTLDPKTAENLLKQFAGTKDKNVWSATGDQRHYRDDNIALIQLYLGALGRTVAVDGILGPETEAALEAYWGTGSTETETPAGSATTPKTAEESSENTKKVKYHFGISQLKSDFDKNFGAESSSNPLETEIFEDYSITITIGNHIIRGIYDAKSNMGSFVYNSQIYTYIVDDTNHKLTITSTADSTKCFDVTGLNITADSKDKTEKTTEEAETKVPEEVKADDGKKITITTTGGQTTYTYDGISGEKVGETDVYSFDTSKTKTQYDIKKDNSGKYECTFVSEVKGPFGTGDTAYSIQKNADKKLYFIKGGNNFEITIDNNLQQGIFTKSETSDGSTITTDYIIDKFDYDMIDGEKGPMIWKSIHTTEYNNQSLNIGDTKFIKYQVFDDYTGGHKKVTLSDAKNTKTQDLIFIKKGDAYDPVYQYDDSIVDADDHILSSGFGDALSNDTTTKKSALIESTNADITLNPSKSTQNYQCVLDNNNNLTITPTTVYNMSGSGCTGLLHVSGTSQDQTLTFQGYYKYSNNNILQQTPVILKKNANTDVMVGTDKYTITLDNSGLITKIETKTKN